MEKIRIIIADDHQVFRDGIIAILEDEPNFEVIGDAADGRQVLDLLMSKTPTLILMDISMGGANGIETTKLVKEKYPNIKVLALSMHEESDYILKMIEAGAAGYLLKDAGSNELIKAIKIVAEGSTYYSQQASAAIIQQLSNRNKKAKNIESVPLTKREKEVLQLIVEEYSNPEIAEKLFISIRTVDTHRRNLIDKLNVRNSVGLVKYAIKHDLI